VHGIGGSGGLTLLPSTIPDPAHATGTLLSTAFGLAIARDPIGRKFERLTPTLSALSLTFGTWYMLGALGVVAYPF